MSRFTKSLNAADVSLFIGAPCMVYSELTNQFRNEVISAHLIDRMERRPEDIIRPILRARNDMNFDELEAMNKIAKTYVHHNSPVCQYQLFRYMLTIRLDLFDWIPDRLAIDKNTLVKGSRYYERP